MGACGEGKYREGFVVCIVRKMAQDVVGMIVVSFPSSLVGV